MFRIDRRVSLQIVAIMVTATVFGLWWNRSLISGIATGKGIVADSISEAPSQSSLPLPLGLMQVKELFDRHEAVFVDARDIATYRQGHITGSISLPVAALQEGGGTVLSGTAFSRPLVVYCNGFACHDSKTVAVSLIKAGYGTVYVFEGGFPEWQSAGYPVAGSRK